MKYKVNSEELDNMIANELRNVKLNNILDINKVKEKMEEKIKNMKQEINELGNPSVSKVQPDFPYQKEVLQTEKPEQKQPEQSNTTLDNKIKPRIATFEIPDFLKNIEPGHVIIFDRNELSEGGENLTNKPFKTYNDPNVEKSMNQMWSEEGKTQANVYQAKFEEIGKLVYDYKNGTTQFIEKQEQPQIDNKGVYRENPYKTEPNPVIEDQIKSYISQNIDVDAKINNILTNIVRDYFLQQNGTVAINNDVQLKESSQKNIPENNINTVKDMVEKLEKVDMPTALLETIKGRSKEAEKIMENGQIQKFTLNDKEYFLASNPLSLRKCYTKK